MGGGITGFKLYGFFKFVFGSIPVPIDPELNISQGCMSFRELGIKLEGFRGRLFRFCFCKFPVKVSIASDAYKGIAIRELCISICKCRIPGYRFLEVKN